jgi:hypothetical protein
MEQEGCYGLSLNPSEVDLNDVTEMERRSHGKVLAAQDEEVGCCAWWREKGKG